MSWDPFPPSVSCYSFWCTCTLHLVHTHNTRPVVWSPPAGLSAFSLLPHHLHTNTVCWGPGTNMRHSTFHYWALIIGGWEVAGEPAERDGKRKVEREGAVERDRGRDGVEGWQPLLFPPSLKTHLGPVCAQLKTSLRHLLLSQTQTLSLFTSIPPLCLFSSTPPPPLIPSVQRSTTLFVRPPRSPCKLERILFGKGEVSRPLHRSSARATGIAQVGSTWGCVNMGWGW